MRIGVEYRKVDPEALAATYGDDAADMAEINAIATLIILASVIIAALGLWLRSRKID